MKTLLLWTFASVYRLSMTKLRQRFSRILGIITQQRLLSVLVSLPLLSFGTTVSRSPFVVCEDALWPPYAYLEKEGDPSTITGASYDFLVALTQKMSLPLDFRIIPWKRCLASVKAFDVSGIEAFFNGGTNAKRMKTYHRTHAFYQTHQGYAFSKKNKHFPTQVKHIRDLNALRVCGVLGYNYDFEIKAGLTTAINTYSRTTQDAINRIQERKCDVLLGTFEVFQGGVQLKQLVVNSDFAYARSPGFKPTSFHLWISRASPRAAWLMDTFNRYILDMRRSGEADEIFKHYLNDGDGFD